jgi:hypothetical protein
VLVPGQIEIADGFIAALGADVTVITLERVAIHPPAFATVTV